MIGKGSALTGTTEGFASRLASRRPLFKPDSPHCTRTFNPLVAHA